MECESKEHLIAIGRLSVDTSFRIEDQCFFRESEPVDESAIHTVFLRKSEIGIYDDSIEETIVSGTRFEFELGDSIKHPIKYLSTPSFPCARSGDFWSLIVDDLVPLFPCFDKVSYLLDGMLPIGIECDHGITFRMLESGSDSELFSEVSREIYSLHSHIFFRELLDLVPGLIRTSIVHEHYLIVVSLEKSEHRKKLAIDIGDIFFFAVGGDDDGEEFLSHG